MAAILNPAAGRGKAAHRWRHVDARLRERGIRAEACETSGPGDATRLTREALSAGHGTIIAAGGDGTIHEVVNGFLQDGCVRADARLAILPAGTSVDFARNLGVRRGLAATVRRLARGEESRVDVGSADGRVFVNFAETGLGASVVARERRFGDAWPGRASFFVAAVQAALTENNVCMSISVDGDQVYGGPCVSVVVANGRFFGGGMKIAPRARMDDGLLDVIVLGDLSRLELVSQIWKVYPGVHLSHRKVLWRRGHTVEITPERETQLDLDGELDSPGTFRFEVWPRALRVIT